MSKTVEEMTLTEIRRECAYRGLPVTASRNDLQCILETIIMSEGYDPITLRLPPRPQLYRLTSLDSTPADLTPGTACFSPMISSRHNMRLKERRMSFFNQIDNKFWPDTVNHCNITPTACDRGLNYSFFNQNTMDSFRKVSDGLSSVGQDLRNQTPLELIESKVNVLETKISQILCNQDQIMARMEKAENDLHTVASLKNSSFMPSREHIRADSPDSHTSDSNDNRPNAMESIFLQNQSEKIIEGVKEGTNPLIFTANFHAVPANEKEISVSDKPLTKGQDNIQMLSMATSQQGYRYPDNFENVTGHDIVQNIDGSSHFVQYTNDHESTTSRDSSIHRLEKSRTVPVHGLETVKAFLPQENFLFSAKKGEDPTQFIINWECILQETNVNIADWVKSVELQLIGIALDWWNTVKEPDLSWPEFKVKFSERFFSFDLQSHLRVSLMTVRQSKNQCLTNFVLEKIKLARQVQTGLSESQIVNIITGLTWEAYSIHVQLWYPTTLMELMRIARMLDFSLVAKPIQNF